MENPQQYAAAKRMQMLMRQFGKLFRKITHHKYGSAFMRLVDDAGLFKHDYYKIIDRPMDFSMIERRMKARDRTRYRHVREIYYDVRLVFLNTMKCNDEWDPIYKMAQRLLDKIDKKWFQFLPKVIEEERRRENEEAVGHINVQLAQMEIRDAVEDEAQIRMQLAQMELG